MPDDADFSIDQDADDRSVVRFAGQEIVTVADLAAAIRSEEGISIERYCEAVNHLEHGPDFLFIRDPAAYVARYEARLAAEDPDAPWREGSVRLRDFGRAQTELIRPPRQEADQVVFFVEDAFLGIPYQVNAPAPGRPGASTSYEPVPPTPLPPPPAVDGGGEGEESLDEPAPSRIVPVEDLLD